MYKTSAILFISLAVFTEAALRGSDVHRKLTSATIVGECTVENFASVIGSSTLASYLQTTARSADMQAALSMKCNAALDPLM